VRGIGERQTKLVVNSFGVENTQKGVEVKEQEEFLSVRSSSKDGLDVEGPHR